MRLISFGDEDGKFAFVGLQPCFAEFKMPFRTNSNKKRIVKTTLKTDDRVLLKQFDYDKLKLGQSLIEKQHQNPGGFYGRKGEVRSSGRSHGWCRLHQCPLFGVSPV